MHHEDVIAAEDEGEVVAIWHSHTDRPPVASDADRAGCEATELPWLILSVTKNLNPEIDAEFRLSEMEVITPNGFEMPYTGRPYVFGIFDCWMLCRDYLKREFNIEINANAHLHIPSWYLGDDDILDLNYRNENLVRLAHGEEPQKGDIFFFSTDELHNFFSPDEIRRTFEENPLKDSVNILIQGAMERGSRDNVTGVAFQFQG